jgi:hypothetical protein
MPPRTREPFWLDGLYLDENGYSYGFDGEMDAETFSTAGMHVGRQPSGLARVHPRLPTLLAARWSWAVMNWSRRRSSGSSTIAR